MSVGDRVRARRKALGMTATALAKLLGVGSPRLARIELTKIEPRADVIRTLAKALKVSADYLLELDDRPGGYGRLNRDKAIMPSLRITPRWRSFCFKSTD
jgi:transcriptional regulator with XRE-family HTH domain